MPLSLVILAVEDVARAARFYRDAFGFPQQVDEPVYAELRVDDRMRLGLYARDGFARNTGVHPAAVPDAGTTSTELYFHVEDLEVACARLQRAGARLLSVAADRPWGDRAAYFADPDGNVVVVAVAALPAAPG